MHLQILTFNKAGRLRSTVKISCVLFVFLFCVSYSFGAKWEPKSWTDCVYTLSSALGDACHGANALCWLCVWHSYITNTSHWGPQSGDCLSFCLPENGTEMGEFLKITSGPFALPLFLCPTAASEIERENEAKERRERMQGVERKGGWWVCLSSHALGKQI